MRTFIVSLFIFGVLLAVIFNNFLYTNKTVEELKSLSDDIISSTERLEALEILETRWKRCRGRFEISVNHLLTNAVSNRIAGLRIYIENEEHVMILHEIAILKEELSELGRLEALSLENIF